MYIHVCGGREGRCYRCLPSQLRKISHLQWMVTVEAKRRTRKRCEEALRAHGVTSAIEKQVSSSFRGM